MNKNPNIEITDFLGNNLLIYPNIQNSEFLNKVFNAISNKISSNELIRRYMLDRKNANAYIISEEIDRLIIYNVKFLKCNGVNINILSYPKNMLPEYKIEIAKELSYYGFNQTIIANVLDISQSTVSNYINNR